MKSSLSRSLREELPAHSAAPRRVILLGASNLTKGIAVVLETAFGAWGRPLEVLLALGHGRSFGRSSRILGRRLPGILECGLWPALARGSDVPTASLVTDIGNDLLYEEPVERISGWVEACFDRLAAARARTVVTTLPVDNLQSLSRARFTFMRTLFFPHSRLSLETVSERARALDENVRRLAAERGFGIIVQRADWYGFDPIHIKLRLRAVAWREILGAWRESVEQVEPARTTLGRMLYLRSRVPERRRVFGIEQRGQQPCGRLNDGSTVALY